MKHKLFNLSLAFCLASNISWSQCLILGTAVPNVTPATLSPVASGTIMSVAYNPINKIYYSVTGGFSGDQMTGCDGTTGAALTGGVVQNLDYRGAWWNPNLNQFEGNGFGNAGIYVDAIAPVTGYPTSTNVFSSSLTTPNSQSQGAYDYVNNYVVVYNASTLYKYNRTTGAMVSSTPITGLPAATLNSYGIAYTGCSGMEYGVYDYSNRKFYFINAAGAYVGQSALPGGAPSPSTWGFSYANNVLWLNSGSGSWFGYDVVNPCPTVTVTASGPTTFCPTGSVVLTSSTGANYQWYGPSGIIAGATNISYTASAAGSYSVAVNSGCPATSAATVNVLSSPTAIIGTSSVCPLVTITLSDAAPEGVWSSGNTAVAIVGSSSGAVKGISAGTAVITYGCGTNATKTVTVNPAPLPITGSANACLGQITNLSDATPLGHWSSSNTTIAPVGALTGAVTGSALGVAVISYTLPTTCFAIQSETVNPIPNVYNVTRTGSGVMCANDPGFHILLSGSDVGISYQLYTAGVPVPIGKGGIQTGTGSPLDFGLQTGNGANTVVATNISSGCSMNMSGNPTITVNPLPIAYPVTISSGGAYCSGGTGVDIQLTNSSSGVKYQLYLGALPVGTAMAGPGLLDFGLQTGAGTYTIVGTDTTTALNCSSNMSNSVTEIINPLPNVYTVSGGGSYCAGSPAGKPVTLSLSDVGTTYNLILNGLSTGISKAGTGSSLLFASNTLPGTYTISATNATNCTTNMAGSVVISINPLPNAYPISAGANYCPGSAGSDIKLGFSNTGISYQLFNTGGPVGGSMLGTGDTLDFGIWPAGTYNIVGTNVITHCSSNMTGSSVIAVSPLPTAYPVTGTGAYCSGGVGDTVGLNSSDATAKYQLYLNGVAVPGALLTGTGSALIYGPKTDSGTYTIVATATAAPNCSSNMNGSAVVTVNPLPTAYTLTATAGGAYCAGSTAPTITLTGSDVGTQYQLYYNGAAMGSTHFGSNSPIVFGVFPLAGTYTVVAINLATNCTGNMANSIIVSINPVPVASAVTGGGAYCAGGSGEDIKLSFSTTGVNYQLYRNGIVVPGALLPGSGGPLDFGLDTASGTYTVIGSNSITGCSNNMTGSQVISTTPLPTVYTVMGGGGFCAGGLGSDVKLSASNTGIDYQLYNGSIPVGGTVHGNGHALDFGLEPVAGTYVVVATNATTSCTGNMAGSATVTVNLLPNIYTVSGGGNYCAGSTGRDVSLPGSDNSVNYQLYLNGIATGLSKSGTGSALDFGIKTVTGTYTVAGVNGSTGCTSNMSGSAIISISALPAVYTVTGGGAFCAGDTGRHIAVSGSGVGNIYQLYKGGVIVPGASAAGTGAAVDLGLQAVGGTYTVIASNPSTGCSATMSSAATLTVNAAPKSYTVTGGGSYCAGGTGVDIGLSNSDAGITYQLYNGTTPVGFVSPGVKAPIDFGLHAAAGMYTVLATNPATGCTAKMDTNATVLINTWVTPMVTVSSNVGLTECAGTSTIFTAAPVNGGAAPTYQWYKKGLLDIAPVLVSGLDSSYTDNTLANLDVVSVVMTSSAPCPAPPTASGSVTMNVNPTGTPSVFITEDPGVSVCQGTNVTFTAAPNFGGSSPVYYWTKGGSVVDSGNTYNYIPNNGDLVSLLMIGNYPCSVGSDSVTSSATITTNQPSTPVFSIISKYSTANLSLGQADTLTVKLTSGGGPAPTYQWVLNTTPLAGETSNTLVRNNFFDKDSVSCIVTGSGPCGGNAVSEHVILTVRNTTGTGTISASGVDIRVVPNPNKGAFTIKGTLGTTDDEEVSLEITNMLGQSVYRNTLMTHNGSINEQVQPGNALANGMYLLSVRSGSENNVYHFVIEQ